MARFLFLALATFLPGAYSDTLDLTYTVDGVGGQLPALTPLSSTPFAWIDTNGAVTGANLGQYNFNPFIPAPDGSTFAPYLTGSTLLSNSFTLNTGESLNVAYTLFSTFNDQGDPDNSLSFAALVHDSQVQAVLVVASLETGGWLGDMGPIPGQVFVPSSSGVSATMTPGSYANSDPFTLGDTDYNVLAPSRCILTCGENVAAVYTPEAGTYQLLFGSFSDVGRVESGVPALSALAVTAVSTTTVTSGSTSVPEPSFWLSLSVFLILLFVSLRYAVSRPTQHERRSH